MATSIQKSVEIAELVRRSAISRSVLTQSHADLKHRLDISSRFKASLREEPKKWLGGSLVTGFLASFLFKSRKRESKSKSKDVEKYRVKSSKKERGIFFGLMTLGLTLAKPAVKIYATKLVKDYLSGKLGANLSHPLPSRNQPPR